MKKALGALAGALAAPLIVVVGVAVLYPRRGPENWDFGTPLITLAALIPAAFIGAVIGYVAVDLVRHNRKALGWIGGGGVLLIVLIPVGIVALITLVLLFSPSAVQWLGAQDSASADNSGPDTR